MILMIINVNNDYYYRDIHDIAEKRAAESATAFALPSTVAFI